MHSLHLPFVSPTEIGGKTIIFYSYCNTSAPPVICNTCLNRGKNCKQITLPPDYENKHNKLKKIVCNRIILFCMHTFALSCYINL